MSGPSVALADADVPAPPSPFERHPTAIAKTNPNAHDVPRIGPSYAHLPPERGPLRCSVLASGLVGVLIDVTCDALLLPRPKFELARKALAHLAEESPDAFEDADAVARAIDLEEALASAHFRYEKDAKGDLTVLRYGVDKAPSGDDSWPEAICRALAPAVTKGTITVGYEGEPHETRYAFGRGKLRIERRKKAAKKKPAKSATKRPDAVVYAGEPTTFTMLPEGSLGIVWNIHAEIEERGWYRDRARVAALVDRLFATAYMCELGTLAALDRPPAINKGSSKRGALDPAEVKKVVANGQKERWSFTREDGEVSVDLGIYELEAEITFRARDAGLARLGAAAHADPRALVGDLTALVGDAGWLHGDATPFAAKTIDEAARLRLDLPVHWPPGAFALILDARIPDHEELHDEVKALLAAKAPKGCEVTNHGKVRIVTWPFGKRDELRAAVRACDAWLGRHVERFVPRTPKGAPPAPPVPAKRSAAPPGEIANYELWWRIEFEVFDRSSWHREPARIAHVVEAIAKTAWWSEVASPGRAGIDEVIARASTGARGETHVKGVDAKVTINRFGVDGLHLRFVGKAPALARMGARATSDVVTLVCDLAKAFRGRANLAYACARPYGGPWAHRYTEEDEPTGDFEWPEGACTVLVLQPGAEGSEDPPKLARVRALAAATPPEGARREERDGLVVLTFLEGAADPIAAADASQAHARWQRWVRGDLPAKRQR